MNICKTGSIFHIHIWVQLKIEGVFLDLLSRNTLWIKNCIICWNQNVRTDQIKSPGMQFRHIWWCNFVRVMQFRQFIFYILYLCISPGALGFNLENNVESWNFQEGNLNTHLTPSYKVPKNPRRGNFLPTMAAIATGWVLQYPKILQLIKYLS